MDIGAAPQAIRRNRTSGRTWGVRGNLVSAVALKAPCVVHLSADFPDPIEAFKTPVIRTLLELTSTEFDHVVFSLNRVTPKVGSFVGAMLRNSGRPKLGVEMQPFEHGTALRYYAPSRGLFHATMLYQLGDRLADEIIRQGLHPALIVGHKLGIEGLAARRAAQRLGVPYAISIQGDTDTKVLKARPDLGGALRKVFHEAAMVFPFTPWALRKVEATLGVRKGPCHFLPCPTDLDTPLPPTAGGEGLISCFHLKNHKRKNLAGLAGAMALLAASRPDARLEVIGGGSDEDLRQSMAVAASTPGIAFAGGMGRIQLRERMSSAVAFAMPSHRESFGLVFIEALFCGLPIIYPADQAVDGYFDGAPFALKVDATDPKAIAQAMQTAIEQEVPIKAALAQWQQSDDAKRFMRPAIAATFARGIRQAIGASAD